MHTLFLGQGTHSSHPIIISGKGKMQVMNEDYSMKNVNDPLKQVSTIYMSVHSIYISGEG